MFKRFPRFSNCNLVSLGDINQLISTTSFSGVNTCKMLPLYIFNSELDLNSSNDFTSSSCNDDASVSANIASDNELPSPFPVQTRSNASSVLGGISRKFQGIRDNPSKIPSEKSPSEKIPLKSPQNPRYFNYR